MVASSWVSIQVLKSARLIAPSITQGAVNPSWRRPAMNVWVTKQDVAYPSLPPISDKNTENHILSPLGILNLITNDML